MKHLTLTTIQPNYGFASGDDGEEYFVPRHMIIKFDIDDEDVGRSFTANISSNFNEGLDLIAMPFEWDADVDVIANLEDAIARGQDLLTDLRLATAEAG